MRQRISDPGAPSGTISRMNAKTNAQRQADYRAKKKAEQSDEVRGIFAPKHLHEAIKAKIREFIEKNKTA